MIALLENARGDIQILCRQYGVRRLTAFGSAVVGDFSDSSDLDFLVEFEPELSPAELADAFFSLKSALEERLERTVDLVTPYSLSNPWFRQSVEASEALLYAA